ncbi:hypothetical protein [Gynuella sunshinyii]|uniref:Uncharacterized protein n=1 Tax=Gynuella sunshinyii YC6258 TaxID=1445510 RepID=A0A0C5VM75_9GAMM|nr:hypothetical protein [Gynuella sunshinyii]AJQ92246.1 hypothetical Protein YC6258_00194 [Gynuella sunshinyii YC6258]AJQ95807.1 hypothetical Protein YC6258_03771 [Gynuella sunshinyii YC6258]
MGFNLLGSSSKTDETNYNYDYTGASWVDDDSVNLTAADGAISASQITGNIEAADAQTLQQISQDQADTLQHLSDDNTDLLTKFLEVGLESQRAINDTGQQYLNSAISQINKTTGDALDVVEQLKKTEMGDQSYAVWAVVAAVLGIGYFAFWGRS